MPEPRAILRILGEGGVRLLEVRNCLEALEHAYNAANFLDVICHDIESLDVARAYPPDWPRYWMRELFWMAPGLARTRGRNVVSWPPTPEQLASATTLRHRLVLHRVRLESPGWWDFLGKLNPLEVIREYLKDRHERRKDREWREAAQKERAHMENHLLRAKVFARYTKVARGMGATPHDLAPLLNELIFGPLRGLDGFQDRGLIGGADLLQPPPNETDENEGSEDNPGATKNPTDR
jgi:hypothetical protein